MVDAKIGDKLLCVNNLITQDNKCYFTSGLTYEYVDIDTFVNNFGVRHKLDIDYQIRHFNITRECNSNINPKHYAFNIKGTPCDLFDIGNAMDLNKEQFTALRYFRKKENMLEDTKKAIKCLERLVERLESEQNG